MRKLFFTLALAASVVFSACSSNSEETDDKDSIDAARSADSMVQEELNSDTSMNTESTIDNMPTDSMARPVH